MLHATQAQSIKGTEKYFDILSQGDYYTGQEINGTWNGKAALQLGLEGAKVTKGGFTNLLRGLHPITGKKLAQRLRKDRRPGVDLTYSLPKSVSLAWAINQDERIPEALREAVKETMTKDVEPLVYRRLRSGKNASSNERVPTGKLIYADFLHTVARPAAGSVDPHLHIHAFVMNYTTDGENHYAAELEEIFRERPSLQAKFDARLIRRLRELGYEVEKVRFAQSGTLKNGWELKGIERSTIEKFSQRTIQVEEYAAEHGISDAAAKGKLGVKTRQKKDKGATIDKLRQEWRSRLTPEERKAFDDLLQTTAGAIGKERAEILQARLDAAIDYALEHHLYRQSTVEKHVVVGTALEHGLTLSPEEVEAALVKDEVIHRSQEVRGAERSFITTREILEAERRLIAFARDGRGTRMMIGRKEHEFKREWLNDQQKDAVRHVLTSTDNVIAVTGRAGAGKSSLMEEAAEGIQANGKKLFVFAPSTGAREVLQEKGFDDAQTVEHLIRNEKLHPQLNNQVLWIDEAGLMDVRSMNAVFKIAKEQNARIVLSGDTRQHSSPRRGEAMRLLEAHAGLHVARVDRIQRQKGQYKRAVEFISQGHQVVDTHTGKTGLLAGFDLLDKLEKIKEIPSDERRMRLAEQYLAASNIQENPLVVAPTHAEGERVTEQIRDLLRKAGAIGEETRQFMRLQSLNFSEAEKSTANSYDFDGMVVQFHQNARGGFKRGERYRVVQDNAGTVMLETLHGSSRKPMPLSAPDRFEVYQESHVEYAKGDKIRFSLGGKATDGKRRISNGRLDEVVGFDRLGNVKLKSGLKVAHDFGHWDLGYCITSHASQGKDRKLAIAAISSQSLPAVNAKQFYVTVSRGREDVMIYVDDKEAVRRAIQNTGDQLSATELVHGKCEQGEQVAIQRIHEHRRFVDRVRQWWQRYFPHRQTEYGRELSVSGPFNHSPELSRS